MAQLNSRGTLTRGRWDYFERSNGIASVFGSVASGGIGAYFINNSTGPTALDVYTITWSASVALAWSFVLCPPTITGAAITPTESHVLALQPDQAQPPGGIGMFSSITSPTIELVRFSNAMTGTQLAPIMGSYFVTLPPQWAIALGQFSAAGNCELSFSVWYQEVLDNIAPAR